MLSSTVASQRHPVHTNLFDPNLYKVADTPKGAFKPQRQHPNFGKQGEHSNRHSLNSTFDEVKGSIYSTIPDNMRQHLPELDVKITILCLLWYVLSSISSNLTKAVLRRFPHPVGLTEIQFLLSAGLCVSFVSLVNFVQKPKLKNTAFAKNLTNFPEGILPIYLQGSFRQHIVRKFLVPHKLTLLAVFPMGIFQFVGHIASHNATSVIPVSLVQSVKALSPIVTVLYYRLFERKNFNVMTYYTLLLLVFGVIITCVTTSSNKTKNANVGTSSKLKGLLYAFVAMMIFVSQNIFAKTILTVKNNNKGILPSSTDQLSELAHKQEHIPKNESLLNTKTIKIDKITILFYCSCTGFLLTFPVFLTNELFSSKSIFHDLSFSVITLIILHAISHFVQAILAFQLIGMLSSVNYSVANIMKRIVIISVSLIWDNNLNFKQIIGLFFTVCGLYGYDKWGINRKGTHTHKL